MDTLSKQMAFILELDKLKAVQRKALVRCDNNRYENSAEHSWHVALAAQTLKHYADTPVDEMRVVTMLLLHDLVEMDVGDTFAFAEQSELAGQHDKEKQAAKRIFGMLPQEQGQDLFDMWMEFEEAETNDARFAKAMDRILPLIQNMANEGGSWAQHKISKSQVIKRNIYLQGLAPKLWDYAMTQIELAVEKGWLLPD